MLNPGEGIASGKEWSSNGVRIAFPMGITLFFCRLGIKGGRENSKVEAQLLSQKQFNERMIDPDRFFSQTARKGSWQRSHGIFSLGRCRTRGGFLGFRNDGNAGRHIGIRRCRCVSGGHGIAKDRARRFGIVCAVHALISTVELLHSVRTDRLRRSRCCLRRGELSRGGGILDSRISSHRHLLGRRLATSPDPRVKLNRPV